MKHRTSYRPRNRDWRLHALVSVHTDRFGIKPQDCAATATTFTMGNRSVLEQEIVKYNNIIVKYFEITIRKRAATHGPCDTTNLTVMEIAQYLLSIRCSETSLLTLFNNQKRKHRYRHMNMFQSSLIIHCNLLYIFLSRLTLYTVTCSANE